MADELTAEEKAELAKRRAEKEQARKDACVASARAAIDKAGSYLTDIESGVTLDEARIGAMAQLREAINYINEAG